MQITLDPAQDELKLATLEMDGLLHQQRPQSGDRSLLIHPEFYSVRQTSNHRQPGILTYLAHSLLPPARFIHTATIPGINSWPETVLKYLSRA